MIYYDSTVRQFINQTTSICLSWCSIENRELSYLFGAMQKHFSLDYHKKLLF